ncbi:MAG: putative charged multivesicular body protein 5 [Piptocephalis tieghemiana]|nr:MAG: putative charged multivesicular body protein 5 [Piptocephalis tieghemiana]
MNRFFGTSKKKPNPTLNQAISSTDNRVQSVDVKLRRLEAELLRYKEQMSKMRDGPTKQAVKQRAVRVLQQKRLYESQRESLQQQVFNMEQASFATDNLKNTAVTVEAMTSANKELKKQYKGISVDKIESIQDEMEDLMDQANEIQETMGRTYAVPDEVDDGELEAELDALGEDLSEMEGTPSYLMDTQPVGPMPELEPLPQGQEPSTAQSNPSKVS